MATQYTSLLGLALPVTGELSGSWGATVNTAITSLLDEAVAGTTSITVDADITLTTLDGVANEARQAIILWNPASGTVTRNVTAPAQSKIYTVINASGGTQSIVFRGAGPTTGVTVVKGESAVVAWNGTDFIKISNIGGGGVFTTLSVSGAVTLSAGTAAAPAITTSGDTNTGIFFPAADTIAFTEGGVEAMRITDAGNVGIGTSSPAVSGLEISRATGSASPTPAELRISTTTNAADWSTTSPWGRLSFYSADTSVSGAKVHAAIEAVASSVSGGGSVLGFSVVEGTGGTLQKTLEFFPGSAGTSTTFYSGSSAEAMRITSAGNVGIGTSSPGAPLEVAGSSMRVSPSDPGNFLISPNAAGGAIQFRKNSSTADRYLSFGKVNNAFTYTEYMRITDAGNVGIGTSSPGSLLHLSVQDNGGAYTTASLLGSGTNSPLHQLRIINTSDDAGSESGLLLQTGPSSQSQWTITNQKTGSNVGDLIFRTRTGSTTSAERMRITDAGNVGIGTSSPTFGVGGGGLAIVRTGGTATLDINRSDASVAGSLSVFSGGTTNGFYNGTAKPLVFFTSASERMRITDAGNVGIGTSSPATKLDVDGQIAGKYAAVGTNVAAQALATNHVSQVTISANTTLTTTVPPAGAQAIVIIVTSGTTSRTVTFGTGFASTGTLATGTVAAVRFVVSFVSDGTRLIECSRTTAITV